MCGVIDSIRGTSFITRTALFCNFTILTLFAFSLYLLSACNVCPAVLTTFVQTFPHVLNVCRYILPMHVYLLSPS